jgi:hypothetical protein
VIDPTAARRVGAAEVRGFTLGFVTESRFATYREDDDGVPWIDIWEVTVR